MKYRILTDGTTFKVQMKYPFGFWHTATQYDILTRLSYPRMFTTLDDARAYIDSLKNADKNRRDWKVVEQL